MSAQDELVAVSDWIDSHYEANEVHEEAQIHRRINKIGAEYGEVMDALSGVLGENPRKGVTHTWDDVIEELLDVAVASLGAIQHLTGEENQLELLEDKINRVWFRALGSRDSIGQH